MWLAFTGIIIKTSEPNVENILIFAIHINISHKKADKNISNCYTWMPYYWFQASNKLLLQQCVFLNQ